MNFLQGHYNQIRRAGGDRGSYAAVNDLSKEMELELEEGYQAVKDCKKCDGLGFLSKGEKVTGDCSCWKSFLKKKGRER